jgi:hypothetical protein
MKTDTYERLLCPSNFGKAYWADQGQCAAAGQGDELSRFCGARALRTSATRAAKFF